MEHNSTDPDQSTNPKGTCQKILDSFSDRRRTICHISCNPKENSPVSTPPAKPDVMQQIVAVEGSQSDLTPSNRTAAKEVPVRYEIPVSHTLPNGKGSSATAKEPVDAQTVRSTKHGIVNFGKTRPGNAVSPEGHNRAGKVSFKPEMVLPAKEEGKKLQHVNSNDRFSDYIHRAKMKFRSTSHVGDKKRVARLDSINDKISAYISRAKAKLRTTTHVWDDSNASPK